MSICTLTARRVKPGQMDALREAWMSALDEAPEEIVRKWAPVYLCRDVTDENVLLTFGFFQGSLDDLREAQSQQRGEQLDRIAPYVDEVLLDGAYEVVEVFNEQGAPR
jgi:hypothetical protein